MESLKHKISSYPKPEDLFSKNILKGYLAKPGADFFNVDNLKKAFSLIDFTTLDVTDTKFKVGNLCRKVNSLAGIFPGVPNVAAICVYPALVGEVKKQLKVPGVQIASVIGGFPASQTFLELKTLEAKMAIDAGATEADMVISVGKFLEGNYQEVFDEIVAIKAVLGSAHLKVILETGALNHEQIYHASLLAMEAGADFIKTSTGKFNPAATPEAMAIMCLAINEFQKKHKKKIGIKPAGGIASAEDAMLYFSIVKNILGDDWLNNKLFRIGASRLATKLLEKISEQEGR
ncbi:MAG: deoxyribose-phosphate aldolase [Bacteroidota bacterium]|nr:deoxyribose-phosphate aldolase [Bacteroidota bacterium]